MNIIDLPRSMSVQKMAILELLVKSKEALKSSEIEAQLPEEIRKHAAKSMSTISIQGWCGNGKPKGCKTYSANNNTRFIVKHKDRIKLSPIRRYAKKVAPAPAPPPQLNISSAANNVADNISALIHQNAALIDTITKIRNDLNTILGDLKDGGS